MNEEFEETLTRVVATLGRELENDHLRKQFEKYSDFIGDELAKLGPDDTAIAVLMGASNQTMGMILTLCLNMSDALSEIYRLRQEVHMLTQGKKE